jgi:hypothetical protein
MGNLKLVFSQPYPLRKLSPETVETIGKIVALRAELYEQVEALELALGIAIQGGWMAELVDFDYPGRKQLMTLEEGQRFVAKLMHELELEND